MRQPQWEPSARETNLYTLEHHVLKALGETTLADLDKFSVKCF
jgi:hypothetical protein